MILLELALVFVEEKIVSIVIDVTAEDMFNIEYFEGNASRGYDDGQQMI